MTLLSDITTLAFIADYHITHNNLHDIIEQSYLHLAVQDRHIECVKQLLSYASINVNAQDDDYRTPLPIATPKGNSDYIQLLFSHRTIPSNMQDMNRNTSFNIVINSCKNYSTHNTY